MAKKTLTVGINETLFNLIDSPIKSWQVESALVAFFNLDPVTLKPIATCGTQGELNDDIKNSNHAG